MSDSETRPVLLLALAPRVADRVVEFANRLAEREAAVVLVIGPSARCQPGADLPVRVLRLPAPPGPPRWLEDLLVRPARSRIATLGRRIPVTLYAQLRPVLLARRAIRTLPWADLGTPAAVVAGDIDAVPLGWRLARRHPGTVATSALRLEPLIDAAAPRPTR